jgi:signal transduction histidine kinase
VTTSIVTGVFFCSALSILFLLLLQWVFRPMRLVSAASGQIAGGMYEKRIRVSGRGEHQEMAESFNRMADAVEASIAELAEEARRRQEFADNLAHELRTPMTSIYGYAQYLRAAHLGEDERIAATEQILSESRRIMAMSELLLSLAKLREGEFLPEEVPVEPLFADVRESTRVRRTHKGVGLSFACEIPCLTGEREMLKSLLINLTDNAVNASHAGGRVLLKAYMQEGRPAMSVTDFGEGMRREELARVTEPFYRVDKARSRLSGGAGLGLSICAQIVARHGAEMFFISAPGAGTTVKILFTAPQ